MARAPLLLFSPLLLFLFLHLDTLPASSPLRVVALVSISSRCGSAHRPHPEPSDGGVRGDGGQWSDETD